MCVCPLHSSVPLVLVDSPPVLLSVLPLSHVLVSVGVDVGAVPVLHVVYVLALVLASARLQRQKLEHVLCNTKYHMYRTVLYVCSWKKLIIWWGVPLHLLRGHCCTYKETLIEVSYQLPCLCVREHEYTYEYIDLIARSVPPCACL